MHTIASFIVSILIALHIVSAPVTPAQVATSTTKADMPVLIDTPDITIYAPVINGKQTQPEDWQCEGSMCSTTIKVDVPAQTPTPSVPSAPSTFTTPSGAVIGADGTVLFAPHSPVVEQPTQSAPQVETAPPPPTPATPSDVVPASPAPTEQECKTVYAHRTGSVAWYRCQSLYGNQ